MRTLLLGCLAAGVAQAQDADFTLTEVGLETLHGKIDHDKDGNISVSDLHAFAKEMRKYESHQHMRKVEGQTYFDHVDANADGRVTEDEVLALTDETMLNVQLIDLAKFKAADLDKSGDLDTQEFRFFFHPDVDQGVEHAFALHHHDSKDKDQDGFLNIEEFFGGAVIHQQEGWDADFKKLDKNKDDKLDVEETKAWDSGRHYLEEAMEWLATHADTNKDGQITLDEFTSPEMLKGLHLTMAGFHLEEWGRMYEVRTPEEIEAELASHSEL